MIRWIIWREYLNISVSDDCIYWFSDTVAFNGPYHTMGDFDITRMTL